MSVEKHPTLCLSSSSSSLMEALSTAVIYVLLQRELREQQQQQHLQQQQHHLQQPQVIETSGRGSSSLQLKWADRKPVPVNKVKSLAEIQAEEQEQLARV
jgi:hypothetical protein